MFGPDPLYRPPPQLVPGLPPPGEVSHHSSFNPDLMHTLPHQFPNLLDFILSPHQVGPGGAIGFTQRLESTKAKIDFYRSSKFCQSVKS